MIGKDIIEYVQSSKCLGVTVDNHLNWNLHIDGVSKPFKAKVSQLRRMSYLPATVREEIYFKTNFVGYLWNGSLGNVLTCTDD